MAYTQIPRNAIVKVTEGIHLRSLRADKRYLVTLDESKNQYIFHELLPAFNAVNKFTKKIHHHVAQADAWVRANKIIIE